MVRKLHENHFIIFDWRHAKLSETFLALFKYCVRILSHFFATEESTECQTSTFLQVHFALDQLFYDI